MALYQVNEKSYINGSIVEAGTQIEYTPPKGTKVSGNLTQVAGKDDAGVSGAAPQSSEPATQNN